MLCGKPFGWRPCSFLLKPCPLLLGQCCFRCLRRMGCEPHPERFIWLLILGFHPEKRSLGWGSSAVSPSALISNLHSTQLIPHATSSHVSVWIVVNENPSTCWMEGALSTSLMTIRQALARKPRCFGRAVNPVSGTSWLNDPIRDENSPFYSDTLP